MSVCPWDLSRSINQWEKIERSIYSNEMLLAVAEQVCANEPGPALTVSSFYDLLTFIFMLRILHDDNCRVCQIPRLINHSDSSGAGGEGNKESDDAGPPPSFADADGLSASGGDYDVSLKDVAALHIRPGAAEPQIAVEYPEMMMLDQGSPLDIKNALIVDKTTRYEMERAHYNCEGEELKRELTLRGMVYENIKRSFNAHVLARDNIVSSLTRSGINVTVVKAAKLESIDLSGFHIIMTAGGDGTFLRAAQASSNGVPVLG
ncbi:nadk2, partial [Symbiodinium microadriaticum]